MPFVIPTPPKDVGYFENYTQVNSKKVENIGYELGKWFRQGIAKEVATIGIGIGNGKHQGPSMTSNVGLQTKRAVESVKEKLQRQQQPQQQQQPQACTKPYGPTVPKSV
jgi:hypothetical protein